MYTILRVLEGCRACTRRTTHPRSTQIFAIFRRDEPVFATLSRFPSAATKRWNSEESEAGCIPDWTRRAPDAGPV